MGEVRSEMLRVRVRPGALKLIDARLGGESRSVWLRQLVAWALENNWVPGQEWQRKPYRQIPSGPVPDPLPPATYLDGIAQDREERMVVARAAQASAELRAVPVEEGA